MNVNKFKSLAESENTLISDLIPYFEDPNLRNELNNANYTPFGFGRIANAQGGLPINDEARIAGCLVVSYVNASLREGKSNYKKIIDDLLSKYSFEWIETAIDNLRYSKTLYIPPESREEEPLHLDQCIAAVERERRFRFE